MTYTMHTSLASKCAANGTNDVTDVVIVDVEQ